MVRFYRPQTKLREGNVFRGVHRTPGGAVLSGGGREGDSIKEGGAMNGGSMKGWGGGGDGSMKGVL